METTLAIRTRGPQADSAQHDVPDPDEPQTPSEPESPTLGPIDDRASIHAASRRVNEPYPPNLLFAHRTEMLHARPRNRSPYSRSHLRSYSAASTLSAPPMARTRSLPNTAAIMPYSYSPSHSPVRSSSPRRSSPANTRPSPRRSFEERRDPATPTFFMDIESIAEDSELDLTPRGVTGIPPLPLHHANTIPRSTSNSTTRRQLAPSFFSPTPQLQPRPSSPLSTPPSASASRFNEAYPTSSVSSTPTSLRSRSPSISSLETIPDSPDAEEAAIEAFNIAKLKAAAEAADRESGSDSDGERMTRSASTSALSARSADKSRKRWSVCGAERRGDLEMETIWED